MLLESRFLLALSVMNDSFVYSSAFSYCDLCFTVIPLRLGAGLVCVLLAAAGARAEAMVKVGRTSL